jgi:hypothetical protein
MNSWIEEGGFRVSALHPGSWCGRSGGLSYQDLLVLERTASAARRDSPRGLSRLWLR